MIEEMSTTSTDCDDGVFCKHCVAVALAVTEEGSHDRTPGEKRAKLTLDDVRLHLARQDKETLIELLMQQAMGNAVLRRHLLMQAAREQTRRQQQNAAQKAYEQFTAKAEQHPLKIGAEP